jgi:hypothetical protein
MDHLPQLLEHDVVRGEAHQDPLGVQRCAALALALRYTA